jgi:hypothetical protein
MDTSQVKQLPYNRVIIALACSNTLSEVVGAVFDQLPPQVTTVLVHLSPNLARIPCFATLDSFEAILACDLECCSTNGFTEHISPP